jgi:hypothetical protein
MKKNEVTNNGPQYNTEKTKDCSTRTLLKLGGEDKTNITVTLPLN